MIVGHKTGVTSMVDSSPSFENNPLGRRVISHIHDSIFSIYLTVSEISCNLFRARKCSNDIDLAVVSDMSPW